MACENARSESEWSLGRPAASPTCKGHQREGRRGCTRSRRQGGHGGGTGSGGVEQSGQRAQRGGGRRGAESAEGRVCRGGLQRAQRVQRLQWAHTHGAEGAEATEGAEYSRRSSRSAAAVHRRWPPPPGGPTRLWPACGSCPWPWRTAQASARPLPGAGCKEGAERVQSSNGARAERMQSVQQSACRALQSACRQPCALAKPMSRPVFLRMAFSITSLFLKRSVDSLVITTILRPSACSRRSTACGCVAGAASSQGAEAKAGLASLAGYPRAVGTGLRGGREARGRLRGLRERL